MPWRCALCLGGTQNTQSKADTSSFTIEELQHNSFPLFLFSQTIVTMSKIFSAKVHVWVGVAGSNLGRGPPLLCSSFPAITLRWLPFHSQTYAWDLKISKRCFSRWLTFVPPSSPEALFWIPGRRTSVWRTGHPLRKRGGRAEITSSGPTPPKTASHSSPAWEDKDTLSRRPSKTKRREIKPQRRSLLHFVLILRVGRQKEEARPGPGSSSAARREDWC